MVPIGWGTPKRIGINYASFFSRLYYILNSFPGLPELSADQKERLQVGRDHLVKDYGTLVSREGRVGE